MRTAMTLSPAPQTIPKTLRFTTDARLTLTDKGTLRAESSTSAFGTKRPVSLPRLSHRSSRDASSACTRRIPTPYDGYRSWWSANTFLYHLLAPHRTSRKGR